MHTVGVLYFGLFYTFKYSPLHLYPYPHFSAAFNTHPYSSTFTFYTLQYFFFFLSFPKFHCYKNVLQLSLYMIMFVLYTY
jgi:hypothetical protein